MFLNDWLIINCLSIIVLLSSLVNSNIFCYVSAHRPSVFTFNIECREDVFVAAARKKFEYMIRTTYLHLIDRKLYMSLYTPSTH